MIFDLRAIVKMFQILDNRGELPYHIDNTVAGGANLLIRVDPKSDVPIFLQIVHEVKSAIARGGYMSGEVIPSVRQMAAQVLVNPNTVARAYRELKRDGVLNTRRGLGVFVSDDAKDICRDDRRNDAHSTLARLAAEARRAGISDAEIRDRLERVLRDGPEGEDAPKG